MTMRGTSGAASVRRSFLYRAALGLLALVLTGCASSASSSSYLAEDLSEFEHSVLDDGRVTRDELDDARRRTVLCLEAEGFSAAFQHLNDRVSALEVDSGAPGPSETDVQFEARFDSTISDCSETYLNDIDVAWLQQTAPSEEERRAALDVLQRCVEPYGIQVPAADAEGLKDLFNRIDSATAASTAERDALVTCFQDYSLASATGG